MTALHSDQRAVRNVAVLVAAQAILGAQMPMLFVVGGSASVIGYLMFRAAVVELLTGPDQAMKPKKMPMN